MYKININMYFYFKYLIVNFGKKKIYIGKIGQGKAQGVHDTKKFGNL